MSHCGYVTLLEQRRRERLNQREALRMETRNMLQSVLRRLAPADHVLVFGSLIKPGRFSEYSDIDIALEHEPNHMSQYQLTALLAEEMGRPVDVILLSECRFRDRIVKEAELWTLTD